MNEVYTRLLSLNLQRMEDSQSLDTTSNFSSLAGVPDHLESQYAPLEEMFEAHHTELPAHHQPVESNSDGMGTDSVHACDVMISYL